METRNQEGGFWYLRAVQGRFSVNLRMIPVISCLENRAVALMLHCLSRPFPLPLLLLLLLLTLRATPRFTPTILTMSGLSQWLSSSASDLFERRERKEKTSEPLPLPLPLLPICTLITRISGKLHGALTGWTIVSRARPVDVARSLVLCAAYFSFFSFFLHASTSFL